jgi:hypothetical protein
MARKIENRAFTINCLRTIARSPKVLASLRLRALDRLAVMEGFYPVQLDRPSGSNLTRYTQEVKTGVDERVEQMLKQLGGTNENNLS